MYNCPSLSLSVFLRTQLCQAIVTVADKQDRSPALLKSLVNSLLTSFSSYEITDEIGRSSCSAALMCTVDLSKRGYLAGNIEVARSLADLISSYTVVNNVSLPDAQEEHTRYPVNKAVRTFQVMSHILPHSSAPP